ncbi:MAG: CRTAC1 family protein [Pirellulaceae bacterium]
MRENDRWHGRWLVVALVLGALFVPEILRRRSAPERPELQTQHEDTLLLEAAQRRERRDCIYDQGFDVDPQIPGFRDVTDELGIDFQQILGPLGTFFFPEITGSGGALLDYDNDDDLDLYLINCGRSPQAQGSFPAGTRVENRLYQQQADGRFVDVTEQSGLGDTGYGMGCAAGDIDNDGDVDIYVTNYRGNRLFENRGDGTFEDITEVAGAGDLVWGTSTAFFDFDRDGWLDLMVARYTEDPQFDHCVACGFANGRVSYCGPKHFQNTTDRLFRNEGLQGGADGQRRVRFKDVTESANLGTVPTAGMGLICADLTGDGWPDIYVANDMFPNPLWVNLGDGTFHEEGLLRGVAFSGTGAPTGSMGVAVGDFGGKGLFDLVVTNLDTEHANWYRGLGEGQFEDVAMHGSLARATRRHSGWGAAAVDVDHDGHEDLLLVNGRVVACDSGLSPHGEEGFQFGPFEVKDPDLFWQDYADRNLLLLNDGTGDFLDRSSQGGDFCRVTGSARALIVGDLDNDGDLDLVVTYTGQRTRVYRNEVRKRGHWLMVRVVVPEWNRDAYGAKIVVCREGRQWSRLAVPSMSYLASNDVRVHFGLGAADRYDEVQVFWPHGVAEVFDGGPADRFVTLRCGEGRPLPPLGDAP